MAGTDTVGETLAATGDVDYDVVVVGGGAAGLSAATYLARYGFETLVLARGKSAIRQCAHIENHLGFPGGVSPERFLALGRSQVDHEGGTVREELVESVERVDLPSHDEAGVDADGDDPGLGGFRVESDDGEYRVRYVLAATAYDGDMFASFGDEVDTDDEYGFVASDDGRTEIEGLYAAGWMTDETVHQVVVSAGHGAHAAISLVRDDIEARYWQAVADLYVDWVVDDDRYAGDDEWHADTEEWFEDEVRREDVDEGIAADALAHLKAEFLDRCLPDEERERRDREGQRKLLEHLDDDVIREYVDGQ